MKAANTSGQEIALFEVQVVDFLVNLVAFSLVLSESQFSMLTRRQRRIWAANFQAIVFVQTTDDSVQLIRKTTKGHCFRHGTPTAIDADRSETQFRATPSLTPMK